MLDFSQANIIRSAVTWVGNKEQNEGIVVPNSTLITVNDYIHEILINNFFKPFEKSEEFFYFHHNEDLSHNAAFQHCMSIFENPEALSDETAKLSQKLYDLSISPKMKGGEFFVILLDGVQLMGESVPAIGIFKINQKEPLIRVEKTADAFALSVMEGINANSKSALTALVLGVDEVEGYRILAKDSITKKDEPSMWLHQFLNIKPIEDNYFNTRHYIAMTSDFITQKAGAKFSLDTTEKIDLLNKSAFYFKENEQFEIDDFAAKLFDEPEQQEVFKAYKEEYAQFQNVPLDEHFDINKSAVRKTGKVFKNVIKLDTNFSLYVHGRRDLIEKGFDEDKGKPFYKLYYEKEE